MHVASDVLIIGAGPAGLSAAIHLASNGRSVMLIDSHDRVGGQISYSHWVDNYPPFSVGFSGAYYSSESRAQLARFGVEVVLDTPVTHLKKHDGIFTVNDRYLSKTVLVATGLSPNVHDFPVWSDGACNIVTGPELTPTLHKDDRVVVYGAGNSAGQAANYYVSQGAQVIVMSRRPASESMDLYLINQLRDRGVTFIVQQIRQVSKDGFLLGDRWSGYPSRLHVFTGYIPACNFLGYYVTLDEDGYILVDHDHMTVTDGLFAAGDCVHGSTHKLSCAVGDATICVESIDIYLDERV